MKLITVKEAKEIKARNNEIISTRAIQNHCANGDIKHEKVSGTYLIYPKSLEKFHLDKRGPKLKKKKPIF